MTKEKNHHINCWHYDDAYNNRRYNDDSGLNKLFADKKYSRKFYEASWSSDESNTFDFAFYNNDSTNHNHHLPFTTIAFIDCRELHIPFISGERKLPARELKQKRIEHQIRAFFGGIHNGDGGKSYFAKNLIIAFLETPDQETNKILKEVIKEKCQAAIQENNKSYASLPYMQIKTCQAISVPCASDNEDTFNLVPLFEKTLASIEENDAKAKASAQAKAQKELRDNWMGSLLHRHWRQPTAVGMVLGLTSVTYGTLCLAKISLDVFGYNVFALGTIPAIGLIIGGATLTLLSMAWGGAHTDLGKANYPSPVLHLCLPANYSSESRFKPVKTAQNEAEPAPTLTINWSQC